MRRLIVCSVVAGTAAVFSPPAAQAMSGSSLVITAYDGTNSAVVDEVTLKCDPPGGAHADAETACATLEFVDGDPAALGSLGVLCPMIYQPVRIEVGGHWRDRVVTFEEEYSNLCVAYDESEGVFRF